MDYLKEYYERYDEEGRLLSRHGQVEYRTTMKYIHDCLRRADGKAVLEIGAGTGRYSVALAREGFTVTAVELLRHNLDQLAKKLDGTEPITLLQGSALDLSAFPDGSFDVTLLLIPRLIHLGVGCRRGVSAAAIEEAVKAALSQASLRGEAVVSVSSLSGTSVADGPMRML